MRFSPQAPPKPSDEDELDLSEGYSTSLDSPLEPHIGMGHRRGHSGSASECPRASVLSLNDEPFTPVRNLAILNYQRRSIFSTRADSNISSDPSLKSHTFYGGLCSRWKGHEKLCLAVVFLSVAVIVIGGVVGVIFAVNPHYGAFLTSDIQQSPRVGVRLGAEENLNQGNELDPGAGESTTSSTTLGDMFLDAVTRQPAEVGCNELYTFKCGGSQCLPIPMWCDGKVDCPDGSDEADECAMHCPPNFFACLNHTSSRMENSHAWCIPETLICNGVADCSDLSDEYFCRCNHEQVRCSDGICKNRTDICRGADSCTSDTSEPLHCNCLDDLPQSKFCDGFPDCADSLDEIECLTTCEANDQFSCWRSGYACIHKTSVCDGIRDCSAGEDEEECLRLLVNTEHIPEPIDFIGSAKHSGILLVRRWGAEFSPVCITHDLDLHTDQRVGTMLCNHFGYARLLYTEPVQLPATPPAPTTKFYAFSPQHNSADPSKHFVPMKSCPSGNAIRLHCTEMMCEPRAHRNTGVVVTGSEELTLKKQDDSFPFITQIYKKVWNSWVLRCGGVVVHPSWLITSAECIDKNGFFKSLSGPYWQATNPKLMQNRDVAMIAMPPETTAVPGHNDIVLAKLDHQLECHDFLRPVCLPDMTTTPIVALANGTVNGKSRCSVLGWNITANRASSIPYPAGIHIIKDVEIVAPEECLDPLEGHRRVELIYCVKLPSGEHSSLLSDPGGLLVCSSPADSKHELFGVLSNFLTKVHENRVTTYAIYSNLSRHLVWILREFVSSDAVPPQ